MSADNQKAFLLFFVEDDVDDTSLLFKNTWLPDELSSRLGALPEIDGFCFSVPSAYSGRLLENPACVVRSGKDDAAFWKEIFANTKADHIIKLFCDSPFLDALIISDMLRAQTEYLAEFTYSENLPDGLSCEIISRSLTDSLPDIENTLPLSQVVRSNINKFDMELFYKEPDIRSSRLSFRNKNPRDRRVMERLWNLAKGIPNYDRIGDLLVSCPEAMYVAPSYLEVEISGACGLNCIFCCRSVTSDRGFMRLELFAKLLGDMKHFELPYTVCLGGFGEPLENPRALDIIKAALDNDLTERLIVETNGLNITRDYMDLAASSCKLITIANINGVDKDTYFAVHGADGFEKVIANALFLQNALNAADAQDRLYVQIMKINETEAFLDRYYDFWEEKQIPVILQKQNTWLGKIKDRRYSDLTPLERMPCCHLQRDMFVLSDGTVTFCKQDITGSHSAGSAANKSLAEIYLSKQADFIKNVKAEYPPMPDCAICDEWYTFNF